MNVKLKVLHAGPLVSVQDHGRHNYMRYGVSPSGAMDRASFALANVALGNPQTNPAIEVSLGGLVLKCIEGAITVSVIGGEFNLKLNNEPLNSWSIFTLNTDDTLAIAPGRSGSWCYLCFTGRLNTENWLGSQSAHLNSGVCGSAIVADTTIDLHECSANLKGIVNLNKPHDTSESDTVKTIRTVLGPQDRFFNTQTLASLFKEPFKISTQYDRMGMRFNGAKLPIESALNMPSEPISRGSLQVPGHGDPICLMADHQTVGGYPKIATVISADLDALAQCRSGDDVQFEQVSVEEAIMAARKQNNAFMQLRDEIMLNSSAIENRLWNSNLISGAESGLDNE